MLSELSFEPSTSSSARKETKSSILIKYDYLKSPPRTTGFKRIMDVEDGFCGFSAEEFPENPWFEVLRKEAAMNLNKSRSSNNNYLQQKKLDTSLSLQIPKAKAKSKAKSLESPGEIDEF
jgi:hypothetical protein